jgi:cyclase
MPTLLHKDVGLVKGVGFDSWRRTGAAMQTVKVYNMRQVDEIVFMDIAATPAGRGPDFSAIDELADECFMPMTVGGGVRNIADVKQLLRVGADKIALNTSAIHTPTLISEIAARYGTQCVVVSIDARRRPDGRHEVFTHCGKRATGMLADEWAARAEELGAGELLLTSIERDGTMDGYDLELTARVCRAVKVPVIASGGAGNFEHMAQALRAGASAVAAASIYHFTEQTPLEAKEYLANQGFRVRS